MKIPNPFVLAFRVATWPVLQVLNLAIRSVRFQTWVLTKLAQCGAPQRTIDQIAGQFNQFNHDRGIPAKFVLPDGRFPVPEPPVERATSDEEKTSGEAKL